MKLPWYSGALSVLCLCAGLLCLEGPCRAITPLPQAAGLRVWAVDDLVHIDPQTSRAYEANPDRLPGGLRGDYRHQSAIWSAADSTVTLAGAQNEVVAFQLVVQGPARKVTVQASDLTGPQGSLPARQLELFREWYIHLEDQPPSVADMTPLGQGWYPDALIPLDAPRYGNGFSIPSRDFHDPASTRFPDQKNQALWIDLHIPPSALPGDYTGTVTVTTDGLNHPLRIKLHVWRFAIPATQSMHAELMDYGSTIGEESIPLMLEYYRLANAHRVVIADARSQPPYDGHGYDWTDFDRRFGPLFDGSAFTTGPGAGVPLPFWIFPVEYGIDRVDKQGPGGGKPRFKDWPVEAPRTSNDYGVVFTEPFKQRLLEAMHRYEDHFLEKGWTHTQLLLWQDSLDEPGFHVQGAGLEAGREQARTLYETARLVRDGHFRQLRYKLDIGSGFNRNRLDLDGDGQLEGARDVVAYLGPVVDLWSVHGLTLELPALEPVLRKGAQAIFYNGYFPRVGPNTLGSEGVGFRTWAVAAWRSGLNGWADWAYRWDDGRKMFYEPNNSAGRNFYVYRGEDLGMPDRVFASMRLKSMRRGAQDFEMLRMLANRTGKDQASQALAARVCGAGFRDLGSDLTEDDVVGRLSKLVGTRRAAHWSHDPEQWERFHRALGEALEGKGGGDAARGSRPAEPPTAR